MTTSVSSRPEPTEPRTRRPTDPPGAGDQVAGEPPAARVRRWRPFILAVGLLLIVTVVVNLLKPQHSDRPLAIDNPGRNGAQALARLLRDEGVSVETVRSTDAAVRSAGPNTTVVLLNAGDLDNHEREELSDAGADIVVLGALHQDLTGLSEPAGLTASEQSALTDVLLTAQCADADATAAVSVLSPHGSVRPGSSGAIGCFPVDEGGYAYATAATGGGGALRVIADAGMATNSRLTDAGHASLAVRALGHHDHVVWFDASQQQPRAVWDTDSVPRWMPVLILQGAIIVCALAAVRGRRFGPIVVENLPVVVRATETTRGRGRLYRRAGARDRAARALRTATALRLAPRLGLPSQARPADVADAAAQATGYPPRLVHELLCGPVPSTDRVLADLAVQLDRLESEVLSR